MTVPLRTQHDMRETGARGVPRAEAARGLGVSRNTVSRYADMADMPPAPPLPAPRARPSLEGHEARVDSVLSGDLGAPRKQRHTARRICDRLVAERGYSGSYSSVCRHRDPPPLGQREGPGRERRGAPEAQPAGAGARGGLARRARRQARRGVPARQRGLQVPRRAPGARGDGRGPRHDARPAGGAPRRGEAALPQVRQARPRHGGRPPPPRRARLARQEARRGRARLLFQVVSGAYERQSVAVTTNLEFSRWVQVFGDDRMAAAVIDRVVHHGRLLGFRGESHRVRNALMQQA